MQQKTRETAAARLAQVAFVVRNYRELVDRFDDMRCTDIDLDIGERTTVSIEDPEFGYQLLGIVKSLLGALDPLVC